MFRKFNDYILPIQFTVDAEVRLESAASVFRHFLPEDSVAYNQDRPQYPNLFIKLQDFLRSHILPRSSGSACLLTPPHPHHVTGLASDPACSVQIAAFLTVPAIHLSSRPPLSA